MLCRTARSRALLALFPLAALAACTDEPPTLSGDPFFPGGSRPVTLEAVFPASEFLELLGVHTNFGGPGDWGYLLVANQFGGALSAHTLFGATFPTEITYSQDGVTRTDAAYRAVGGQLVLSVDT